MSFSLVFPQRGRITAFQVAKLALQCLFQMEDTNVILKSFCTFEFTIASDFLTGEFSTEMDKRQMSIQIPIQGKGFIAEAARIRVGLLGHILLEIRL